MTESNPFEPLHQPRGGETERGRRLVELAYQWDATIRQALRALAQTLWPDGHLLRLIPVHHYRLRYRADPDVHVWWVEHDIPPMIDTSVRPTGCSKPERAGRILADRAERDRPISSNAAHNSGLGSDTSSGRSGSPAGDPTKHGRSDGLSGPDRR